MATALVEIAKQLRPLSKHLGWKGDTASNILRENSTAATNFAKLKKRIRSKLLMHISQNPDKRVVDLNLRLRGKGQQLRDRRDMLKVAVMLIVEDQLKRDEVDGKNEGYVSKTPDAVLNQGFVLWVRPGFTPPPVEEATVLTEEEDDNTE